MDAFNTPESAALNPVLAGSGLPGVPSFLRTDTLRSLLTTSPFVPSTVLAELRAHPKLEVLLDGEGCKGCAYSLEVHTLKVMEQFEKYFGGAAFQGAGDLRVFRLTLALHDIGKPLATLTGRSQHECTIEIIDDIAQQLPLAPAELKLLKATINGDPLGQLFQNKCSLQEAHDEISSMAAQSGMDSASFFRSLVLYFQSDTGAYTSDAGTPGNLNHQFVFADSGSLVVSECGTRLKFSPPVEAVFLTLEQMLASTFQSNSVVH